MSSTSSILAGYDNNNEIARGIKTANIVPSGEAGKHASPPNKKTAPKTRKRCCSRVHLNSLWSFWYGILCTGVQAYTAVKCIRRLLGYSFLTWPESVPIPYLELNASLGLTAASVLLLPLFFAAAMFKIGNLANDGFKLGRQLSVCSRNKTSYVVQEADNGDFVNCSIWRHGGPTAPFVHLVIAFCLLVPKLLMEAKLIEAGFLSEESIWQTDLDFMVAHRDRLVVLSFMTGNSSSTVGHQPSTLEMVATAATLNSSYGNSPHALPLSSNTVTHTVLKTLKTIVGHENHTNVNQLSAGTMWGSSISMEYINLALALLVYSVRYPSLFWSTNKCIGMLFSFQLLMNSLHSLLGFAGMSILYKLQIVGVWKTLPLLKHQPGGISTFSDNYPFLLNPQVALALYLLSTLLVLSSSLVLYLYGYTRLNAFLNQKRERKIIVMKGENNNKWNYFTHCAALCVLIAVGVCNAPLLHDYTVVYKGSLDDIILSCIIGGILHLFLWVVVWLFLTIKQNWVFKLQVRINKATVHNARSIKLVTDVDCSSQHSGEPATQPLLVVGNGRTYSITDNTSKKSIMGVIQRTIIAQRKLENGLQTDEGEEQIYWLRPAHLAADASPDDTHQLCWFARKPKHKVTFNESTSTSINRGKGGGGRCARSTDNDEDDGDYATLRELPLVAPAVIDNGDDTASEEGKLLACMHDEHVTYASNNQDLVPPVKCDETSPLLGAESSYEQEQPTLAPVSVIVHTYPQPVQHPRYLNRADSGVPHEEFTPRSDSMSTGSSASPPEGPESHNSETSSGVHSNSDASSVHVTTNQHARRATSVADLVQPTKEDIHWKSGSLQRNVMPDTLASHYEVFRHSISPPYMNKVECGIPALILQNSAEDTVVIRRKLQQPKIAKVGPNDATITEEPFGRATNMRMTSFTEHSDLKNIQASSATLPLYPTQPILNQNAYPHCSTMPLPLHNNTNNVISNLGGGYSCNVYPRQHTTIPTHHNGVKLFNSAQINYIKRLQSDFNNKVLPSGLN